MDQVKCSLPLPPIQRLPLELLLLIFSQCMPQFPSHVRQASSPYGDDPLDFDLMRRNLAAVCASWRKIITSTPKLWSTIVLNNPESYDAAVLEEDLPKSQNHPLDIHLSDVNDPDVFDELLQLFAPHTQHIRNFIIDFTGEASDNCPVDLLLATSFFPPNLLTSMPLLEQLSITGHRVREKQPMGPIHAPKLSFLQLPSVGLGLIGYLTPDTRDQVRELSVSWMGGPGDDIIRVLSYLPNLTTLHWEVILPSNLENDFCAPLLSVLCERLEILRFFGPESALTCLHSLSMPALKSIGIRILESNNNADVSPIIHSLVQKTPLLQSLHLIGVRSFAYGTAESFPNLPHLTTLTFEDFRLSPKFFHGLIPDNPDGIFPCPKLRHLGLHKMDFSIVDFKECIDIRWHQAQYSRCARFQSIQITPRALKDQDTYPLFELQVKCPCLKVRRVVN